MAEWLKIVLYVLAGLGCLVGVGILVLRCVMGIVGRAIASLLSGLGGEED